MGWVYRRPKPGVMKWRMGKEVRRALTVWEVGWDLPPKELNELEELSLAVSGVPRSRNLRIYLNPTGFGPQEIPRYGTTPRRRWMPGDLFIRRFTSGGFEHEYPVDGVYTHFDLSALYYKMTHPSTKGRSWYSTRWVVEFMGRPRKNPEEEEEDDWVSDALDEEWEDHHRFAGRHRMRSVEEWWLGPDLLFSAYIYADGWALNTYFLRQVPHVLHRLGGVSPKGLLILSNVGAASPTESLRVIVIDRRSGDPTSWPPSHQEGAISVGKGISAVQKLAQKILDRIRRGEITLPRYIGDGPELYAKVKQSK